MAKHKFNSQNFWNSVLIQSIIVTVLVASQAVRAAVADECDLLKNECKPLKECTVLFELFVGTGSVLTPDTVEVLEKSQCKLGDNSTQNVCCPKLEDDVTDEDDVEIGTRFGEYSNTCRTPLKETGSCIPVRKCAGILKILQKKALLTNEESEFLRQSQCGYINRTPYVCCAAGKNIKPKQQKLMSVPTSKLLPTSDKCGSLASDRIFGGRNTKVDEYPWLAMIEYVEGNTGTKGFHCGGSLINSKYVLTAAHCLSSINVPDRFKPISVRLGEWDISTEVDCDQAADTEDCIDQPLQNIPIESILIHEKFRNRDANTHHDIALIRIQRPASLNFFVSPICLPYTDQMRNANLVGKSLDVAGWGFTEEGYKSNIKLKVDVPVVSNQACQKVFTAKKFTDQQLCAGGIAGKDSCNGDSGGPLMKTSDNGKFIYLAGIVSYGTTNCGQAGYPGVYTKVAGYMDWINSNLYA